MKNIAGIILISSLYNISEWWNLLCKSMYSFPCAETLNAYMKLSCKYKTKTPHFMYPEKNTWLPFYYFSIFKTQIQKYYLCV